MPAQEPAHNWSYSTAVLVHSFLVSPRGSDEPRVTCGALQAHIEGHVQFSLVVEVEELHEVHEQEEALGSFSSGHMGLGLVPLSM